MVGEIIELGSYPRSLVKDEELLATLNKLEEEEASIGEKRYYRYENRWYLYEPLRFVCIKEDKENAALMSLECIDGVKYDDGYVPDYFHSFIWNWLNEDFKEKAFSKEEKKRILSIGLPGGYGLKLLPEDYKKAPPTDLSLAKTTSECYWSSETRSGWTGSFQDYEARPDEVATVETTGRFAGDINTHTSGCLDYPRPVRIYMTIRK